MNELNGERFRWQKNKFGRAKRGEKAAKSEAKSDDHSFGLEQTRKINVMTTVSEISTFHDVKQATERLTGLARFLLRC